MIGLVSTSGTGTTEATTCRAPRDSSVALMPSTSSPACTTVRPVSQAARITVPGTRSRRSMSYTVRGPSLSISDEKSGLLGWT